MEWSLSYLEQYFYEGKLEPSNWNVFYPKVAGKKWTITEQVPHNISEENLMPKEGNKLLHWHFSFCVFTIYRIQFMQPENLCEVTLWTPNFQFWGSSRGMPAKLA